MVARNGKDPNDLSQFKQLKMERSIDKSKKCATLKYE
jgi:predicted secreted protein